MWESALFWVSLVPAIFTVAHLLEKAHRLIPRGDDSSCRHDWVIVTEPEVVQAWREAMTKLHGVNYGRSVPATENRSCWKCGAVRPELDQEVVATQTAIDAKESDQKEHTRRLAIAKEAYRKHKTGTPADQRQDEQGRLSVVSVTTGALSEPEE